MLEGKPITPGPLLGPPWKVWGITVQTSYWEDWWHQNWVCSRPAKKTRAAMEIRENLKFFTLRPQARKRREISGWVQRVKWCSHIGQQMPCWQTGHLPPTFPIASLNRYTPKFSGVSQKLTWCQKFTLQMFPKWCDADFCPQKNVFFRFSLVNFSYQETIFVRLMRRQVFVGKSNPTYFNIWDLLIPPYLGGVPWARWAEPNFPRVPCSPSDRWYSRNWNDLP